MVLNFDTLSAHLHLVASEALRLASVLRIFIEAYTPLDKSKNFNLNIIKSYTEVSFWAEMKFKV
jgi:hypothetical protein